MDRLFRAIGCGGLWGGRALVINDLLRVCRYGHWNRTILVRGHPRVHFRVLRMEVYISQLFLDSFAKQRVTLDPRISFNSREASFSSLP